MNLIVKKRAGGGAEEEVVTYILDRGSSSKQGK